METVTAIELSNDCPDGPLLNVDVCPSNESLVSFVLNNEVYVHSTDEARTIRCSFGSGDTFSGLRFKRVVYVGRLGT